MGFQRTQKVVVNTRVLMLPSQDTQVVNSHNQTAIAVDAAWDIDGIFRFAESLQAMAADLGLGLKVEDVV